MSKETITFIGGGNMAISLIGGLIADGCPPDHLWVSEADAQKLKDLKDRFRIQTTSDNKQAVSHADTVLFAVKPQVMSNVVREVAEAVKSRKPLMVSIAAGVRETDIRRWLGFDASIVRTMPNTPALVGSGATVLYANPFVNPEERNRAESLLRTVGLTLWVDDEALMDAVTALSGSGPAYLFLVMELMETAGRQLGLPEEIARLLTLQTAFGAAKMALESPHDPATLRAQVTSPGGTTERAIKTLQEGGIERLFTEALKEARERAVDLGKMLGDN